MITRSMNTRITIYEKTGGQNEDGEVVDAIRKNILSCWSEIKKTSVKDFKSSISTDAKDVKTFLIRYMPNPPFDNSMYVDLNGLEYRITNVEIDYAFKNMIMIGAVRTP